MTLLDLIEWMAKHNAAMDVRNWPNYPETANPILNENTNITIRMKCLQDNGSYIWKEVTIGRRDIIEGQTTIIEQQMEVMTKKIETFITKNK